MMVAALLIVSFQKSKSASASDKHGACLDSQDKKSTNLNVLFHNILLLVISYKSDITYKPNNNKCFKFFNSLIILNYYDAIDLFDKHFYFKTDILHSSLT